MCCREFGFLWRDATGATHRLRLVARRGRDATRSAGSLLTAIEIDGASVAVPSEVGASISGAGGLSFTLTKQSKFGALDLDSFRLVIDSVLDAEISARAAHPLLQTASDAYVHLNLNIIKVQGVTPAIHGVLGQTYRDDGDREERAMSYSMLAQLLRHPVAADGTTGKGFLDGQVEDYVASSVMQADCKFASAWA